MIFTQISRLLIVSSIAYVVTDLGVIGGTPLLESSSLFVTVKNRFTTLCGGTIVSPYAVVTAAHCLLFFAVYEIYKKNYSFSTVYSGVKFLFFQCKTANSFYSKINDSSRVRTTAFSRSRFGFRVSVVPNTFTIYYPQHFLILEISETLKGSFTKFFGTVRQKILTEYLDTSLPPLIQTFRYAKLKQQ